MERVDRILSNGFDKFVYCVFFEALALLIHEPSTEEVGWGWIMYLFLQFCEKYVIKILW